MICDRFMTECAVVRPAILKRAVLTAQFNPWNEAGGKDNWHTLPSTWDIVFDKAEAGDVSMLRFLGTRILARDEAQNAEGSEP